MTGATQAGDGDLDDWKLPASKSNVDLPAWTDEPTGQIPAILEREGSSTGSVPAPVWRQDSSDWSSEDENFDPLILGSDESLQGALNPEHVLEESQPWEFTLGDLPASTAGPETGIPQEPAEREPWDPESIPLIPPAPPSAAGPVTPPAPRRRGAHRRDASLDDELVAGSTGQGQDQPQRRDRGGDDGGREGRTGRDLPVAVITGVVIALVVLAAFNLGTLLTMILVTIVVTLATAEVYAVFRRAGHHPATLLGLAATISLLIASYNRGPQALGLVTILLFVFTVIWYMAGVEKADVVKGISSTMLVYIWIGVLGSYAALLLNPTDFPNKHGLAFLLAGIILSVVYDVAALLVGSSIGKRPLAPTVSPNKTWEGLIGATVATLVISMTIIPMIHPWKFSSALALGVAVSVVCPLGDLTESAIKRHLGLKHMGKILPGHGGILDRVDGLLFVLPATYYLVKAFNLA